MFCDKKSRLDTKEDSPPPYLDVAGAQILSVDYANWRRSVAILGPNGEPLFTTYCSGSCSTRLQISNSRGEVIGTSKCSNLSSKIEINLTNPAQSFEIHNSASVLGGSPGYTSPAFNGEKVVWKNKAMSTRIIYTLVDGKANGIARFESSPKTEMGKLELTAEVSGEARMNEVVVTILTLLQRKMRNIQASYLVAVT